MYLNFYNLKKQPFHITPDPEFLYLSPSHKEALAAIIYGIEKKKGFVGIIGAVGVGKTTILRSYLEKADKEHLKIIYVFNARLSYEGLLRTIYRELELEAETDDAVEMTNRLYEVLIEEYKQGNTVVLVIDEAQNIPIDTLENLRMLSNLETSREKLIQIVLVGQPEFEEQLKEHRLRQLRQRIAIRSTILPLTEKESLEYIIYRLQKAGVKASSIFSRYALSSVIKKAKGIPRTINVLCDNALITGFGYRKQPITRRIVKEIIRDFDGLKWPSGGRWWLPAVSALTAVLIIIALLIPTHELVSDKIKGLTTGSEKKSDVMVRVVAPLPERSQVEERRPPVVEKKSSMIKKSVASGDTLYKLSLKVYGKADNRTMKIITENNPQVINPNVIHVGNVLSFPELSEDQNRMQ
ncbi:MAG: ATPase [Deltaproteobacteria bacterium]|nr:ATPase [Deltaproteobacteria bacterium]